MTIKKEKIVSLMLIYIFICSVFVDLYNGYVQLIQDSDTILQNIYKGAVFIFCIPCFFSGKRFSKFLLLLISIAILNLFYWLNSGYPQDLKFDIISIVKVFYGYFVFLFLVTYKEFITKNQLINYVILYGIISSISIFLTAYLGVAAYKYGADFSFGIQGLFVAGNDLAVTLLMCNCLSCYMLFKTSKIYYAVANIMLTISGLLIGSVAGLFGSSFIMGCVIVYGIFFRGKITLKKWQKGYFALIFLVAIPVIYKSVVFITTIDSYNIEKFSSERLLSGGARKGLKDPAIKILNSFDVGDIVFGRGSSNIYYEMAHELRLGKSMRVIELDQYELIMSYGFLLGGLLLLLPILVAAKTFIRYIKYRKSFYFWSFIAMALFLGHAFVAGHAYLNLIAMQIVAVIAFCMTIKTEDHD